MPRALDRVYHETDGRITLPNLGMNSVEAQLVGVTAVPGERRTMSSSALRSRRSSSLATISVRVAAVSTSRELVPPRLSVKRACRARASRTAEARRRIRRSW